MECPLWKECAKRFPDHFLGMHTCIFRVLFWLVFVVVVVIAWVFCLLFCLTLMLWFKDFHEEKVLLLNSYNLWDSEMIQHFIRWNTNSITMLLKRLREISSTVAFSKQLMSMTLFCIDSDPEPHFQWVVWHDKFQFMKFCNQWRIKCHWCKLPF